MRTTQKIERKDNPLSTAALFMALGTVPVAITFCGLGFALIPLSVVCALIADRKHHNHRYSRRSVHFARAALIANVYNIIFIAVGGWMFASLPITSTATKTTRTILDDGTVITKTENLNLDRTVDGSQP